MHVVTEEWAPRPSNSSVNWYTSVRVFVWCVRLCKKCGVCVLTIKHLWGWWFSVLLSRPVNTGAFSCQRESGRCCVRVCVVWGCVLCEGVCGVRVCVVWWCVWCEGRWSHSPGWLALVWLGLSRHSCKTRHTLHWHVCTNPISGCYYNNTSLLQVNKSTVWPHDLRQNKHILHY